MTQIKQNIRCLVGTLGVDGDNLEKLRCQADEMKQLGYYGVYFNNIFFTMENTDFVCTPDDILFREDHCLIVRRTEEQLLEIRKILADAGLVVNSSHFLNVLPEPGMPVESLFKTHETILDMAQLMGMQRVTTHIGGIAVPTIEHAQNRPTPAEKLVKKEINYEEYTTLVKELYGRDRILPDSLTTYRHLCDEASKRGITVTIETACSELYEINTKPQAIIQFIKDVGADNLGICIDSGHCHLKHLDIAEVIKQCGDFFVETHFHDNFGINDNHNPVGIGTINWYDLISMLNDVAYSGEITFEQGDYVTNYKNWELCVERIENCKN